MAKQHLHRRLFATVSAAGLAAAWRAVHAESPVREAKPPTRVITRGDGFHWFGYYDKLQFSPDNRFVLSNRVRFQHRSPTPDDEIEVGMIDLHEGDRWIPLGRSLAWNWQQGCMLQWVPGSESKVIWNDRRDGRFVSHILDVRSGEKRTLPSPIYSLSPNGKEAVSCDFARVADCRPGYGYAGIRDPYFDDMAPEQTGITHVDLETGATRLVISHRQLATMGESPQSTPESKHHAYHLLCGPDGRRFILLHRWTLANGGRLTRLITSNMDGSDLRFVIPNGWASHFIWRDADHILSQSKQWLGNDGWGNFLFADKESGIVEEVGRGVLDAYGHFSYCRGGEWLVSDTYPQGPQRLQTPHLFHLPTRRRINLGAFPTPAEYTGEWRVDLHPRLSRDERWVCIDAVAGERGRQLHLLDIAGLS
ncbi:MAG: hypothetical protein U0939_19550 [Pirellulales bacterium]